MQFSWDGATASRVSTLTAMVYHRWFKALWVIVLGLSLCLTTIGPPAQAQKTAEVSALQSLSSERLPRWMWLDLELRSRTEAQTAINFLPGTSPLYNLTRARPGIGVEAPRDFSAYLQFQDTHALGLSLRYVASNMRDTFDLRQAYLQFASKRTTVIAGRQELKFGDERLIGISNWANNSRTFDVVDVRLGSPENRVDFFSGSVVSIRPISPDTPRGGFSLHGAYGTLTTLIPHVRFEPYILFKTPAVRSQQGIAGRETLVAPGGRMVGKLPSRFDYNLEGALERGSYSNDSIHAGAGHAMLGYTASFLPWKPHIKAEYDYASGNSHRNPLVVGTFDQFFPSNHDVFGLTDVFGWQNMKQRRLDVDFHPSKNFYCLIHGQSLHVATPHDAVYSSAGGILVGSPEGGFRSDDIGTEIDGELQYANSHVPLLWEVGVGHLWPGALMSANRHGAPLTLAYFQVTYKLSAHARTSNRRPASMKGD